jgi:hypothetical protein
MRACGDGNVVAAAEAVPDEQHLAGQPQQAANGLYTRHETIRIETRCAAGGLGMAMIAERLS